jgi:hypothetical protein
MAKESEMSHSGSSNGHTSHPDLASVRRQGDRDVRYADYVRRCWMAHQREASRQASEITRRLMRRTNGS